MLYFIDCIVEHGDTQQYEYYWYNAACVSEIFLDPIKYFKYFSREFDQLSGRYSSSESCMILRPRVLRFAL